MELRSGRYGMPGGLLFVIGLATVLISVWTTATNANAGQADAVSTSAALDRVGANTIENSVVKVFATVRYPDPYRP